jgi:hypothetical protein
VQRIWTHVNLEQRCKEIQIQMNAYVMFYIELESVEQKKALKKLCINTRFSGLSRGIFQIHGIPEVWFYTRRKVLVGFTRYLYIYTYIYILYIYIFWLHYATNPKSAEIHAFGDDSPNPASFQ